MRRDPERRASWRERAMGRAAVGLVVAMLVHGVIATVVIERRPRPVSRPTASMPIAVLSPPRLLPVDPPAAPPDVEPKSRAATPPRRQDPPRPPPVDPPRTPPPDQPSPDQSSAEQPSTEAPRAPVDPDGSLLRRRPDDGEVGRVLGTGAPLAPSAAALEGSLDLKVEGPMSDAARAARNVKRQIEEDLADDAVSVGLADDYFRALRNRVETAWRPDMAQLSDGGKSVTQLGFLRSFFEERAAWDEMWRAYLDMAAQYANGVQPRLETARRERIRELMRSRKGMFRLHAIAEIVLSQGPNGEIVTIEMPLRSGHPAIDEGMKDAIVEAVRAMPDPPPPRVHRGRTFQSTWRLRATWVMIPPTALLTGAAFDITPKGIEVDVPFEIKLRKAVLLLRTTAAAGIVAEPPDDGP